MAAVMLATPTTTVRLPDYQVSGAGAAIPRHGASGSKGSCVFGVLAVVLVLTVLSCVFGRVCAAHAKGPNELYDCMRLVRRRQRAPRPLMPAEDAKEPAEPPLLLPLPEP